MTTLKIWRRNFICQLNIVCCLSLRLKMIFRFFIMTIKKIEVLVWTSNKIGSRTFSCKQQKRLEGSEWWVSWRTLQLSFLFHRLSQFLSFAKNENRQRFRKLRRIASYCKLKSFYFFVLRLRLKNLFTIWKYSFYFVFYCLFLFIYLY